MAQSSSSRSKKWEHLSDAEKKEHARIVSFEDGVKFLTDKGLSREEAEMHGKKWATFSNDMKNNLKSLVAGKTKKQKFEKLGSVGGMSPADLDEKKQFEHRLYETLSTAQKKKFTGDKDTIGDRRKYLQSLNISPAEVNAMTKKAAAPTSTDILGAQDEDEKLPLLPPDEREVKRRTGPKRADPTQKVNDGYQRGKGDYVPDNYPGDERGSLLKMRCVAAAHTLGKRLGNPVRCKNYVCCLNVEGPICVQLCWIHCRYGGIKYTWVKPPKNPVPIGGGTCFFSSKSACREEYKEHKGWEGRDTGRRGPGGWLKSMPYGKWRSFLKKKFKLREFDFDDVDKTNTRFMRRKFLFNLYNWPEKRVIEFYKIQPQIQQRRLKPTKQALRKWAKKRRKFVAEHKIPDKEANLFLNTPGRITKVELKEGDLEEVWSDVEPPEASLYRRFRPPRASARSRPGSRQPRRTAAPVARRPPAARARRPPAAGAPAARKGPFGPPAARRPPAVAPAVAPVIAEEEEVIDPALEDLAPEEVEVPEPAAAVEPERPAPEVERGEVKEQADILINENDKEIKKAFDNAKETYKADMRNTSVVKRMVKKYFRQKWNLPKGDKKKSRFLNSEEKFTDKVAILFIKKWRKELEEEEAKKKKKAAERKAAGRKKAGKKKKKGRAMTFESPFFGLRTQKARVNYLKKKLKLNPKQVKIVMNAYKKRFG